MYSIVRTTLETYLKEKRVVTLSDFTIDVSPYTGSRDSVFITLYFDGRVIASSGRIACKKENTFFECIDNTLLCLNDARFTSEIQDLSKIWDIHIRTDRFWPWDRRLIKDISELDTKSEWLILLSQNLGLLTVVLPNMVHIDSSPNAYFNLACKKIWLDPNKLTQSDYVIYGVRTKCETDFEK